MEQVKKGVKTSEFWFAIIAAIIPVINATFGLNIPIEAVLSIAGLALVWMFNRTGLKKDAAKNVVKALLVVFVSLFVLSACATSQAGLATKTMVAMQKTIVGIAQAADDLCSQGLLTQAECDRVAVAYQGAKVSYDAAASALIIVIETSNGGMNWNSYQALHDKFLALYRDMYNVAVEFRLIPAIEGGR